MGPDVGQAIVYTPPCAGACNYKLGSLRLYLWHGLADTTTYEIALRFALARVTLDPSSGAIVNASALDCATLFTTVNLLPTSTLTEVDLSSMVGYTRDLGEIHALAFEVYTPNPSSWTLDVRWAWAGNCAAGGGGAPRADAASPLSWQQQDTTTTVPGSVAGAASLPGSGSGLLRVVGRPMPITGSSGSTGISSGGNAGSVPGSTGTGAASGGSTSGSGASGTTASSSGAADGQVRMRRRLEVVVDYVVWHVMATVPLRPGDCWPGE